MSDDGLFKLIFGREPKLGSNEPDFNRTIGALKRALDNTTIDRAGLVWDSPKKEDEDEAPQIV
jgi:hypothetical protein